MATPVDTSSFTPQQLAAFNSANALGSGVQTYNSNQPATQLQPAAQAPVSPTPQVQTPASPTTTSVSQQNAPTEPVSQQTIQPTAQPTAQPVVTPNPVTAAQPPQLRMPANGSVVDLLNAAGQDSSFASRQQLAQQYGVNGYTGTAAQNQTLAQKYLAAFNASKGTTVPQSGSAGRTGVQSLLNDQNQFDQPDPQANFFDQMGSMNPITKQLYDTIQQTLSSQSTQISFADQYKQLTEQQGIPQLQMDLINVNNVMQGTEDDIRTEITKAGGFATNSQVLALTGARNKTLLLQANVLSNQLQAKEDYVNQVMQFTQMDRAEVDKQIEQKIGLTQKLVDMNEKITSATKDNYNNIIASMGYSGLATALKGNPKMLAQAETILGLGAGALSDPKFLAKKDASQVLGSAATGYFTYNPETGVATPIVPGGKKTPGGTSTTSYKFTPTQLNTGSATAGITIDKFKSLPGEVQNFFINSKPLVTAFNDALASVKSGTATADQVKQNIAAMNIPKEVKDYLTEQLSTTTAPTAQKGFLENLWNGITGFFK